MFRVRRIHDDLLPTNQEALKEVEQLFVRHFSAAPRDDIAGLAARLRNPFLKRFRTILYVAEGARGHVHGFAIVLHEPVINFCYLDYIASSASRAGRGIGAALYEAVRDEARALGVSGLFYECLADEPEFCSDEETRKENIARLMFYERFGARPLAGTDWEAPVPGGLSLNTTHMVVDLLDQATVLQAAHVREVLRVVFERKYQAVCPPEYVQRVLASVRDPVCLRQPLYSTQAPPRPRIVPKERIALAFDEQHSIHHIRERGYVESPVRIQLIEAELAAAGLTERLSVKSYGLDPITAVHDPELVSYLERACDNAPVGKSVYPYVFPIRNAARPPKELSIRAGYYCIDTFTPIHRNAFAAARRAVDCTLTMADALLDGRKLAYALVRPPGHHAERRVFGGFCYLNNAAIAAQHLVAQGKVAILDIDYHHGNGQQDIFYRRRDVLTVSLHGAPDIAYPYFSGFADERGEGEGEGYNLNIPLPEQQTGAQYRESLRPALHVVADFKPTFLIVALGLDTGKGDPTGTFSLVPRDFEENGRLIGALKLPTLVVQEGGYRTRTLGSNARHFLRGLLLGADSR